MIFQKIFVRSIFCSIDKNTKNVCKLQVTILVQRMILSLHIWSLDVLFLWVEFLYKIQLEFGEYLESPIINKYLI